MDLQHSLPERVADTSTIQPRNDPVTSVTPPTPGLPAGSLLPGCDGHSVWWCEGGNPDGLPVLIVHGGPGGSSRAEPTGWFAGVPVRWLALDQRGCGRSLPGGETRHNRLPDLVDDMERLRRLLGLERWALAGGSWGARVALAYSLRHPERVAGLMLRSPFLATVAETTRYGAAWEAWLGPEGCAWLGTQASTAVHNLYCGETELFIRDTATGYYESLATGRTAQAWNAFDDAQSAPGGVAARGARWSEAGMPAATPALMASWAVHVHYALRGWGEADGVPRGVLVPELAPRTPVSLVWGREDATCDPESAESLSRTLSSAGLAVSPCAVEGAGHRMSDPRLAPALARAARDWVARLLAAGQG